MAEQNVVSLAVAAHLLGVHTDTVIKYLDAGKLDGFKLPSGHRRVYLNSIEAMQAAKS